MVSETLVLSTPEELSSRINLREGETKLGETVQTITSLAELPACSARFVLLGIPEDTGIVANQGIAGASTSWEPSLKALLNTQANDFLNGEDLLVLGHFYFPPISDEQPEDLYTQVSYIDEQVYPVLEMIFGAGKVPIVIGGGHNNAYPIIKGFSKAMKKKANVLNIDAHADLRPTVGRHSGNGFSYAIQDGYLDHYGIFGLQQNYLTAYMHAFMQQNNRIRYRFYEDILLQGDIQGSWNSFTKDFPETAGLEVDLDAIQNVLSSATSPSGFSVAEIRRMLLSTAKQFAYLHLAEGAVELADGRRSPLTAKLIAYLITDFIKGQEAL
jgi:formiminoglutamase